MRKSDLTDVVYDKVGLPKKEAAQVVELALETMKHALQAGEMVKIAGFGNFVVRHKQARTGRNPKTGQEIGIAPRRVVTFRPSQIFKRLVNRT